MKKIGIILLLAMVISLAKSQNLVPNGDFETFDTCPNNAAQINHLVTWFQPTLGTPDYFNGCAPGIPITYFSVPDNYFGYQLAHSGNGFAGMFLYYFTSNQTTYREYIESKLIDTLIAGQKYFLKFFISLSDSSNTATDELGIHFSNNTVVSSNWNELPVLPQIENLQGNFLTDKSSWMEFNGQFIAQGGELYLTVGNFKDFFNTDSLHVTGGGVINSGNEYRNGYYYIDDICLSNDSLFCHQWLTIAEKKSKANLIKIYPNPGHGKFIIDLSSVKDFQFFNLFDHEGKKIIEYNFQYLREREIEISNMPSGLYLINFYKKSEIISKKIIVLN